jgi:hypothetical protein
MKIWHIFIGIVVILAIVCSPVLAISKADLISQYKSQSSPAMPIPTQTPIPTITSDVLPPSALWVNSTPGGAMVFIDGTYRGSTPINIWDLAVGTHQLRVFRAGYEDYSTEVTIPQCYNAPWMGHEVIGCNMTAVDVTLKKVESTLKPTIPTVVPTTAPTQTPTRTGTLTIYMVGYGIDGVVWREIDNPTLNGAKVYIDGVFKGYTPLTVTGIPIGSHQVKVIKDGYRDYTTSVTVVEGQERIVEAYVIGGVVTPTSTMSQADLIASYRTPPRPSIGVVDFSTLFEVISAENSYREGQAVYADSQGRLYLNGSMYFGFSGLSLKSKFGEGYS